MTTINIMFDGNDEPKVREVFGVRSRDVCPIEVGDEVLGLAVIDESNPCCVLYRAILGGFNEREEVKTPKGFEGLTVCVS